MRRVIVSQSENLNSSSRPELISFAMGTHGWMSALYFCVISLVLLYAVSASPPPLPVKASTRATCGGVISLTNVPMATIMSPNFPSGYPLNTNCIWRVIAPAGKEIKVFTFQLDIEASNNCQYDSLTIAEANSQLPLGRFCGRLNAGLLAQSSSNAVTITFVSDYVQTGAGFYLVVQAVNRALINLSTPPPPTTSMRTTLCPAGTQNCPGVMFPCLTPAQICDGIRNCADGSDELNCLVSTCGRPKVAPSTSAKIVGGVEAVAHSWPWQVAMYTSWGKQICGATIISNQWILTAAHCCSAYTATAATFRVRIGAHRLSSTTEPFAKTLELESITVHPQYSTDPATNWDYCLMRTKQAMVFSDDVQPACLASLADGAPGTRCFTTGWGSMDQVLYKRKRAVRSTKVQPDALYQVDVVVNAPATCNVSTVYNGVITPQMICATLPAHDSCQGDSGGPLVCPDASDPTKWKLVGVVSWGWGCADTTYPGVYARVTSALGWITSITGIQANL